MRKERLLQTTDSQKIPELGEVLNFMRLLWAVDHGLHSISKRMVKTVGITGPQRLVIRIVGRVPDISAGTLAKVLHIHPSTLTGVLRRLEEKKLVLRSADPLDGRRALLRLTPEGAELDAHQPGTVEGAIAAVLDEQEPDSIAEAVKILHEIAEGLGVEEPL